jgi:hypothetical protein
MIGIPNLILLAVHVDHSFLFVCWQFPEVHSSGFALTRARIYKLAKTVEVKSRPTISVKKIVLHPSLGCKPELVSISSISLYYAHRAH